MQRALLLFLCAGTFVLTANSLAQSAPPLWQQLTPKKKIEADPNQEYALKEEHGPWLIMATSFSGEEGKEQAHDLVLELRDKYNLPAFYYGMTFQLDSANPGRGLDGYGAPIRRRYKLGEQKVEHAVLVGEFTSLEDSQAQKTLERIKQLSPRTLNPENGEESTQSLASVRQFQNMVRKNMRGETSRGPMGHAFLTRNPLLPKEYFAPQGVDAEVAKWNERVEYSLMNCPGTYSIRVATFRGRTSFLKGDEQADTSTRQASVEDPLVVAARNAGLLTAALREKGWEAYVFHDRHESFVAVGSFDNGRTNADGQIVLTDRDAQTIMDTFGASKPNNIFNRPAPQDVQLEEMHKQRFNNIFSKGYGEIADGFHPKKFVGIPFDIFPKPERVPKKSISSAYVRN